MEITNKSVDIIREEINKALLPLGKQLNLEFGAGNCSYNDDEATYKLKVTNLITPEQKESKAKKDFEEVCQYHGFKKTDFNRAFTAGTEKYSLIGFRSKARKYTCICKKLRTGEEYFFTQRSIPFYKDPYEQTLTKVEL